MGSTRNLLALVALIGLALPAAAQDLDRGEELFTYCTQCHGKNGGGNELAEAPAIAGRGAWYVEAQLVKFQTGVRGAHPDDVQGLRMRPMSRTLRSAEDTKAVAAYVASLPVVTPEPTLADADPARGQAMYALCGACHGAKAEGNPAVQAPRLANTQDWYTVRQIVKYKTGVRGSDPRDTTGSVMRGMASTLPDDQAVRDVSAYILSLSQ